MISDTQRIRDFARLIEAGHRDRLLAAQDICFKTMATHWGGPGYAHILRRVVPGMRALGLSEEDIFAILIANPARLLRVRHANGLSREAAASRSAVAGTTTVAAVALSVGPGVRDSRAVDRQPDPGAAPSGRRTARRAPSNVSATSGRSVDWAGRESARDLEGVGDRQSQISPLSCA